MNYAYATEYWIMEKHKDDENIEENWSRTLCNDTYLVRYFEMDALEEQHNLQMEYGATHDFRVMKIDFVVRPVS